MFRMMALAVDGRARGHGLATRAIRRLQGELILVAGPRFGLMPDLASCMRSGGAGVFARQGWSGGEVSWPWRSEASAVEGAGDAPGQCPAPTEGNGEAQAGGKAEEAEPEADVAGGAGVEEAGVEGLESTGEELEQVLQVSGQDTSATANR